jgi:putative tryptophan/tyrosine transport system substrate-binding protein
MISRRQIIAGIGGAAIAWPLRGRAQSAMPVIGFLSSGFPETDAYLVNAFRQGLKEAGYAEGQNVAIEYRWAEGHYDRLAALTADLVGRRVSLIAAMGGNASAQAARAATSTIPIVVTVASDPISLGLVTSLSRPGGNVTGVSLLIEALEAKKLELLRELVPGARVIAMLANLNNPSADFQLKEALGAARAMGWKLHVLNAISDSDFDVAFASLVQQHADALMVGSDAFFLSRREQIVARAALARIPTVYELGEFAAAGGLISYGPSFADAYRQAGNYAALILKGAKPANLPVLQPTKFELVINLKTAQTLGFTIPPALLARADEVIE